MSTRARQLLIEYARRRRRILLAATAVLIVAASGVALSVGNAATIDDAVPVNDTIVSDLKAAASACPALTAARLAAQVMASTGFKATPAGGIAGLSAAQWSVWRPGDSASPADSASSILALAHMTCDLVGQIRVAQVPGEPWRLAVAANRSSVAAVRAAGGVPTDIASYVDDVETYARFYASQTAFGGLGTVPTSGAPQNLAGPASTPVPTPSASPSPSHSPNRISSGPTDPDPRKSSPATTTKPPVRIDYASFTGTSGLALNGAAHVSGGQLNLAAGSQQAASAWSATPIDPGRSFSTSFTFVISNITDGLAFVLQSAAPTALGNTGGGLGYGSLPGDSAKQIAPSLAIEFDTWDNSPDGFDPAGHQHIAVTSNGDITQHLVWGDPGFSMWGSGPVYVWITYAAPTRALAVFASQTANRPANALFTYTVNLASVVGTKPTYAGFTGGTGLTSITDAQEAITRWAMTTG